MTMTMTVTFLTFKWTGQIFCCEFGLTKASRVVCAKTKAAQEIKLKLLKVPLKEILSVSLSMFFIEQLVASPPSSSP